MEGSHKTLSISWDLSKDQVSLTYNQKAATKEELAKLITSLGYTVKEVSPPKAAATPKQPTKPIALPKTAPKAVQDAFLHARAAKRPILIDFWASWCGPCIKLKKETLHNPQVATALRQVELIYIDLDQYPKLAKHFQVTSIPDVLFIDANGFLVDRLQAFEAPEPFLKRLNRFLHPTPSPQPKTPTPGAQR